MGFTLSKSTVDIEINDKHYEAHIGDPDLLYRINAFAKRLVQTNYEDIDGNMFLAISNDIHQFVVELLGKAAEEEIFDGSDRDVIEELRLFLWINKEINKNNALLALDATIGQYSVAETI